jgi:TrmH family RNA methyltransferase
MEVTLKLLRKLTQKKFRREYALCILEGEKIIADNQHLIVKIFRQNEIPKDLLKEIKSLKTYTGDIAVAKIPSPKITPTTPTHTIANSYLAPTTPFLVLDNIQETGNMGTIIRSAAAFGYRTVYCINCADPYSQKIIRASSGLCLQLNIIECGYTDIPECQLFIADLNGENVSGIKPTARNFGIVLGNEGQGVSAEIYKLPYTAISIPMPPDCESLNVAVAGGILMYCLNAK